MRDFKFITVVVADEAHSLMSSFLLGSTVSGKSR